MDYSGLNRWGGIPRLSNVQLGVLAIRRFAAGILENGKKRSTNHQTTKQGNDNHEIELNLPTKVRTNIRLQGAQRSPINSADGETKFSRDGNLENRVRRKPLAHRDTLGP